MGDIMVLTPNTIHILIYLRARLRCRMRWVKGSEWGEVGGDKKAKVDLEFRIWVTVNKENIWSTYKAKLNSENQQKLHLHEEILDKTKLALTAAPTGQIIVTSITFKINMHFSHVCLFSHDAHKNDKHTNNNHFFTSLRLDNNICQKKRTLQTHLSKCRCS